MNNVFSQQRKKAHLQRNAFDLSHSDIFSMAPGMVLPCHVSEVNPGEYFEFNPQVYTRTMPLNSAAFVRLKQHVEFFFVPMRTLCRQWNQWIVGTKYPISAISTLNSVPSDFGYSLDLLQFIRNASSSIKNPEFSSSKNIFGFQFGHDVVRLLDLLSYGVNISNLNAVDTFASSNSTLSLSVNITRALAYQKIYFDHYRNPLYESNDPLAYNIDDKFGTGTKELWSDRSKKFFTLRYRNWSKDYFTSVSPSWQGADYVFNGSSVDMSKVLNLGANQPYVNGNMAPTVLDPSGSNASALRGSTVGGVESGSLGSSQHAILSVANLRAAYALDKLYRLSIAAGDGDYGSQIKAHYGFDAVHDDWKSSFIGGTSAPVSISEVVTTATTEQAPTGDIYGKGASFNSGKFSFTAKEHGIIMGIISIVPEAGCMSNQIDRFNTKFYREEYFQPEFADLGKQPIYSNEVNFAPEGSVLTNDVIGFTSRYMEYKTAVDRVHGNFAGGNLKQWAAPRNNPLIKVSDALALTAVSLKVDPRILNPIMSIEYDGSESTDQFIVDCSIGVKSIRPMSVSGEPML